MFGGAFLKTKSHSPRIRTNDSWYHLTSFAALAANLCRHFYAVSYFTVGFPSKSTRRHLPFFGPQLRDYFPILPPKRFHRPLLSIGLWGRYSFSSLPFHIHFYIVYPFFPVLSSFFLNFLRILNCKRRKDMLYWFKKEGFPWKKLN